jgi:hypothetical protein
MSYMLLIVEPVGQRRERSDAEWCTVEVREVAPCYQ